MQRSEDLVSQGRAKDATKAAKKGESEGLPSLWDVHDDSRTYRERNGLKSKGKEGKATITVEQETGRHQQQAG